jgi:5-methyltetrahydropteroyltriglutamate--homocysteine methyltransferase
MTAASPGVISHFQPNQYYPSNEAYLHALAEAMRVEYRAIVDAGFLLQLDCPDFTLAAQQPGQKPDDVGLRVEMVNHAVRDIPPEKMRLHLCWGNYEGPHHTDIPLRSLLPDVLRARPMYLSFEGANPPPRARVERLRRDSAAARQGHHSRRPGHHHELRRAPRAGEPAAGAAIEWAASG